MKRIKVAAGVLNQTPLDWDGNKRNILAAINAAINISSTNSKFNCCDHHK